MITGQHLIAGEWTGSDSQWRSADGLAFAQGGQAEVDRAATAAQDAFADYAALPRAARADFLESIAAELEAARAAITQAAGRESGLPDGRLQGELGRTIGQLRLFASHIRDGAYLDRRHDKALPERAPAPRPDLRLMQRPVGPVAVFGASNFPLAFSVAGGDTASALAAGCPVVVKAHPAHPETSEIAAAAIDAARRKAGLPAGVFNMIQGASHELGGALVRHPLIAAVGFTGSLRAGRALFDLCAARPEPIPFFGELGSINPVFVLPSALAARGAQIARGWAASLTLGAGQFCTNPGLLVLPAGEAAEAFIETALEALAAIAPQTMLTEAIAGGFRAGASAAEQAGAVRLAGGACAARNASPWLARTTPQAWLANPQLAEEVFGPFGLLLPVEGEAQMTEVARALHGQLTCTFQMDEADLAQAQRLLPILERKAGRLLVNGFPTGVEVADAMVHGGPYPASTNFGATSVGTMAVRRWLRPVSYQDFPQALLPADLRDGAI